MARQDDRHGGPEESDAMHAYCLKASIVKVDWPYVIRMPDERFFYGELQEGKRSQGGQKTPSKPL